jgi:predicted NBD/HSP70 family sugar kinase
VLGEWIDRSSDATPLLGVGLGVPGVFDSRTGLLDSPLLGWRKIPLAQELGDELRLPVLVDNDVNTLAVAERLYGRGRAIDHFVTVTIGRGVGLGIVAAGDIYRGFRGGAGEFGHTTVAPDGPLCSCGKRGCLEALVGDPALVVEAKRARVLKHGDGIERLRALAAAGNEKAIAIFARAGGVLGRAVGDLANVLGPQLVLISGEGTQAWPHLAASFERSFRAALFSPEGDIAVEVDPWDDTKWAVGAATLVLRSSFAAPLENEGPSARRDAATAMEVVA